MKQQEVVFVGSWQLCVSIECRIYNFTVNTQLHCYIGSNDVICSVILSSALKQD